MKLFRFNRFLKLYCYTVILCVALGLTFSCKKNEPEKLQKLLTGTWSGTRTASGYNYGCPVTLTVEENGHYTAASTDGSGTSFVEISEDELDHSEKKMTVYYLDGQGKGHGNIRYINPSGDLVDWLFSDLVFGAKNASMSFKGDYNFSTTYTFIRQ